MVSGQSEVPISLSDRRAELARNLAWVRERIERACQVVGRVPTEITLIAVTKTFPVSDVALLAELGLRDMGENRDGEARGKAERLTGLRWHFVGQLQRNKCRSVATYADVVHSVDRPQLVDALARASAEVRRKPLGVLMQVDLDRTLHGQTSHHDRLSHIDHIEPTDPTHRRAGVSPDGAIELAERIRQYPALTLHGVMGIAPQDGDPLAAFSQLKAVSEQLRSVTKSANWISAGMSNDLIQAVAAGATHVRVGSALLGIR